MSTTEDIEERQNILLSKIEQLLSQVRLYQKRTTSTDVTSRSKREELVIQLSIKQSSTKILDLIERFREQLFIQTYRHSSLYTCSSMDNIIPTVPSSTYTQGKRHLSIIWVNGEQPPSMFHSQKTINDEKTIINLLSNELSNQN
jgi:hypothetical protein